MRELYNRSPRKTIDGIPVFAESDDYIENYDRISDDHLASVDRGQGNPFIDEPLWNDIERNTIEMIRTRVPEGSSILDIGVGTGRLLARFPGLRRHGIDVSVGYLARLGDSGIEACMGNVEDLPYRDGAFDAVVCTDVLEHVLDLHAAVREIRRVLRPGGLAIVRVPYRENLAPYTDPAYPYRLAHVRNFDEHGLAILFCRVLDFDREDQRFDTAMNAAQLRVSLPRGRGMITRALMRFVRAFPQVKRQVLRLYRPLEVTMAFSRPTS